MSDSVGIPPLHPLEYQSVSRIVFNHFLVEFFAANSDSNATPAKATLLAEEDNAVRYASGYVSMKLSKKFEKQSGNKAAQFVQCLNNMAMVGNDSSFYEYTKEWVESVDRGGLFLVNDSTFEFFKAVKVKVQLLLPQHLSQGSNKEALLAAIVSDHDVDFYWCILAVDIEN